MPAPKIAEIIKAVWPRFPTVFSYGEEKMYAALCDIIENHGMGIEGGYKAKKHLKGLHIFRMRDSSTTSIKEGHDPAEKLYRVMLVC